MAERQFDFDFTDDSIGTVRILAVPVAGGGGGGSDQIEWGTFTVTGGSAAMYNVTVSLTYAQITSLLAENKYIILKGTAGTIDNMELPYLGTMNNKHWFSAIVNGAVATLTVAQSTMVVNTLMIQLLPSGSNVAYLDIDTSDNSLVLYDENGSEYKVIRTTDVTYNSTTETVDIKAGSTTYSVVDKQAYDHDMSGVVLVSDVKSTVTSGNTNPVNSVAVKAYAQPLTDKVTVSGASVTQALDSDKMYVFGEVTALTVTLNTSSDSSHVHEYHFRFTSGATATTLSLPASVTMANGFSVAANKTYELSIIDNLGTYIEW